MSDVISAVSAIVTVPLFVPRTDRDTAVVSVSEDRNRPALQAGHPTTWCAITGGTALDGAAYAWRDPLAR